MFDIKKESEFIKACASGDLGKIKEMLAKKPLLLDEAASNGSYPEMFAAQEGHIEVVEYLCKEKPSIIDRVNLRLNVTALWFACSGKGEDWGCVERMIGLGYRRFDDVSTLEGDEVNVLWFPAIHHEWDLFEDMIEKGARGFNSAPTKGPCRGLSSIIQAGGVNRWDLVRKMISLGADVGGCSPLGANLLLFSGRSGEWKLFEELISLGARNFDVALADDPGKTPLYYAICYARKFRDWKFVKEMIRLGARGFDTVVREEVRGEAREEEITPFLITIIEEQYELIFEMLTLGVRDVDAAPSEGPAHGKTALFCAAYNGRDEIISLLLKMGTSLDKLPEEGEEFKKILDVVLLGKKEFGVLGMSSYGESFRLLEAAENLFEVVKKQDIGGVSKCLKILKGGVNARMDGRTALQEARRLGYWEIVEQLLYAGARVHNEPPPPPGCPISEIIDIFIKLYSIESDIQGLFKEQDAKRQEEIKEGKEVKESIEGKEEKEAKEGKETKEEREANKDKKGTEGKETKKERNEAEKKKIIELILSKAEAFYAECRAIDNKTARSHALFQLGRLLNRDCIVRNVSTQFLKHIYFHVENGDSRELQQNYKVACRMFCKYSVLDPEKSTSTKTDDLDSFEEISDSAKLKRVIDAGNVSNLEDTGDTGGHGLRLSLVQGLLEAEPTGAGFEAVRKMVGKSVTIGGLVATSYHGNFSKRRRLAPPSGSSSSSSSSATPPVRPPTPKLINRDVG